MEVKNWQLLGNRTLGSWLEQELMMMKKMCAQLSKQVELQMKWPNLTLVLKLLGLRPNLTLVLKLLGLRPLSDCQKVKHSVPLVQEYAGKRKATAMSVYNGSDF